VLGVESPQVAEETLNVMWEQGRLIEILEWAPEAHAIMGGEGRLVLRKRTVNIVQRAANSVDDINLKKQFLSSKRVEYALLTAKG
jgi:hypothetical protein